MAWTLEYRALVSGWLKGHQQACAFIETMFSIAHTCDDLTDRDTTVAAAQIQESYWKALIELPRNPFYVEHFALLNGAMQTAFLNWQIANQLEQTAGAQPKQVAFILRSSYTDLIALCAWIIGGSDWAIQVGVESRLRASGEGFITYQANLMNERRQVSLVEG